METINDIEKSFCSKKAPDFGTGDRIRIQVKFKEGDETKHQKFEGIVMGRRGSGIGETFTVRKVVGGCGVERIFPVYSPVIEKLDVLKQGKVRRAKLYYLGKK
jgi:large subunit ribosomal protein L19